MRGSTPIKLPQCLAPISAPQARRRLLHKTPGATGRRRFPHVTWTSASLIAGCRSFMDALFHGLSVATHLLIHSLALISLRRMEAPETIFHFWSSPYKYSSIVPVVVVKSVSDLNICDGKHRALHSSSGMWIRLDLLVLVTLRENLAATSRVIIVSSTDYQTTSCDYM